MKVILSDLQRPHYPKQFLVNGLYQPNPECPERIDRLLDGALKSGTTLEAPKDHGFGPIAALHTPEYLQFLEHVHGRWARQSDVAEDVIPDIRPRGRDGTYPKSAVAQAGYHMTDSSSPISADTWGSVYWSAQTAVHAAEAVLDGDRAAYALCRPPGHHAFADQAGGFCYLNNTAIAAERLRRRFDRVAIIDVDLHHGNGTQAIFYDRADVFTLSLHADPIRYYPFFWGHAAERGAGAGLGYNQNLPLPRGTADADYLTALASGLDRVQAFAPQALVIALGLDGAASDPFAGLAITTEGFEQIATRIAARMAVPTVLVQEGGYLSDKLGRNLTAFLEGFEGARA